MFGLRQIEYCGHVISEHGVLPDLRKFVPLDNLRNPATHKEFRSMVGFYLFFAKFILRFWDVIKPIHEQVMSDNPMWNAACTAAKLHIHDVIKSKALLAHPANNKPYILRVDAPGYSASFTLLQLHNGVERPIYFGARKFNNVQQVYHSGQQELLAIVWGLKYFRQFIINSSVTVAKPGCGLKVSILLRSPVVWCSDGFMVCLVLTWQWFMLKVKTMSWLMFCLDMSHFLVIILMLIMKGLFMMHIYCVGMVV